MDTTTSPVVADSTTPMNACSEGVVVGDGIEINNDESSQIAHSSLQPPLHANGEEEEASSLLKRKREEEASNEDGHDSKALDASSEGTVGTNEESCNHESQTKKTKLVVVESSESTSEEDSSTQKVFDDDDGTVHGQEMEITKVSNSEETCDSHNATIEDDDSVELTLLYEDKERALSFYKAVFGVEVIEESGASVQSPSSSPLPVNESTTSANEKEDQEETKKDGDDSFEPDFKLKGYKLRGTLSPKKKQRSSSPTMVVATSESSTAASSTEVNHDQSSSGVTTESKIYVPADKLQSTLEKIKEFSGASLLMVGEQEFPAVICPEGNKLILVPTSV